MIGNDWDIILKEEFESDYFKELINKVSIKYDNGCVFPKKNEIFNAFRYTPYHKLKVVILGQDPYHGEGEAEGLSFSVKNGIRKPPSLVNIFKELNDDIGCEISDSGSLVKWAEEGVLLLNSVLTVDKDSPASHQGFGWEIFTDNVIKKINEKDTPVVFILWGNFARSKKSLITNPKHFVIESNHPSPFSAYKGFFGSKPFSRCNLFLKENGIGEIHWDLNK